MRYPELRYVAVDSGHELAQDTNSGGNANTITVDHTTCVSMGARMPPEARRCKQHLRAARRTAVTNASTSASPLRRARSTARAEAHNVSSADIPSRQRCSKEGPKLRRS